MGSWSRGACESCCRGPTSSELSGEPAELLDALGDGVEHVVLVDAVTSGAPPGTVHRFDASEAALVVDANTTTHGLGLAETIELGRALGRLPARLLSWASRDGATSSGRRSRPTSCAPPTPWSSSCLAATVGRVTQDADADAWIVEVEGVDAAREPARSALLTLSDGVIGARAGSGR